MLKILYEDNHLIAVNKVAGDLVQGDRTGDLPLAEKIKAYIKKKYNKPGKVFLGVIHRLDRPTSGVILFARSSKALRRMNKQFKERISNKIYWAIVGPEIKPSAATLIHWLKRNTKMNKSFAHQKEVNDSKKAILHFKKLRDIDPGEAVFIDKEGNLFSQQCSDMPQKRPCIFEYVYFSRPDSKIDEISVYKARMRMGSKLAEQIKETKPSHDIDVVIPIPDSSTTAAHQLAVDLGVPYREGFVKNRYIGRTFIMPYQEERKKSVRRKLNILDLEFQGKNVLLVDDSIVRGTTSKKIIEMAREAGANKVYFASAAPAIKYQNLYGIDMPATSELIASNKTDDEVAEEINSDWLIYQRLDDLIDAVKVGNPEIENFETSIFTGKYITPLVENYLEELENSRKDELKMQREKSQAS